MRVISSGGEINEISSSGVVPRKSVNPSDKTLSSIDRKKDRRPAAKSFSNFRSLNLLVKKELYVLSSKLSPIEIAWEIADATFYSNREGHGI